MVFGIKLDSQTGYTPGGAPISGSVYFDINKEVSADDLVAILNGEEHSRVKYTRKEKRGSHTITKTYYANRTRNLVQMTIPMNTSAMIQNGKIMAGNYVIPFEIQLPAGLPSSMSINKNGSNCAVQYSLKAQLKGSGWVSDYKCSQQLLLVGQPLPLDPVPYQGPPTESVVNLCCCCNKGSMLFGAHVSDTLLDRGQSDIAVHLACRNRSTVDIESVTANLIQSIKWSAQGHHETKTTTLNTFDFGTAMRGLTKTTPSQRGGFVDTTNDLKEIARDLEEAKYSGTVQLPFHAEDTFPGQLIQVKHYIAVVVATGSCVTDPTITIPVQVGPPRIGGNAAPLPTAPQAEPEIAFNFESATIAPTVVVSGDTAYLGGPDYAGKDDDDDGEIVVESEILLESHAPSVDHLLKELNESVKDYDFLTKRIYEGGEWKAIIASLSPVNYGKLIKEVDLDFDQPKVAELVAKVIDEKFTCDHVVAAIGKCSDWNKASVVKKLLPLTKDLAKNKARILNELSDWDKTVTASAFKTALST